VPIESKRYTVEFSGEAQADLRAMSAFRRLPVVRARAELEHQAELETQQRKPLTRPIGDLPDATWEARVGDYRAFYCVRSETTAQRTVTVLRVILKGTSTTQWALNRAKKP
jgi:mRNA-degrading endonuclease RelE of RelBE toxin-antitoxin system